MSRDRIRNALRIRCGTVRRTRWLVLGGLPLQVPLGWTPARRNLRYVYLGDRLTRPDLRGLQCDPVRRSDRRCVVAPRGTAALVVFITGERAVVNRRRLRRVGKR